MTVLIHSWQGNDKLGDDCHGEPEDIKEITVCAYATDWLGAGSQGIQGKASKRVAEWKFNERLTGEWHLLFTGFSRGFHNFAVSGTRGKCFPTR